MYRDNLDIKEEKQRLLRRLEEADQELSKAQSQQATAVPSACGPQRLCVRDRRTAELYQAAQRDSSTARVQADIQKIRELDEANRQLEEAKQVTQGTWQQMHPNFTGDVSHFAVCGKGQTSVPATSAPGLGSPLPHPHRDGAHPCHICTGTGAPRYDIRTRARGYRWSQES
jgi:hypothetical protein